MVDTCPICGDWTERVHDHKPDNTGLDDGPLLPGRRRKKPERKPAHVAAEIRARAWATRRAKYGDCGHA